MLHRWEASACHGRTPWSGSWNFLVCSELEVWPALHALCQMAPPFDVPCANSTLGDAGYAACWEGINALRAGPS